MPAETLFSPPNISKWRAESSYSAPSVVYRSVPPPPATLLPQNTTQLLSPEEPSVTIIVGSSPSPPTALLRGEGRRERERERERGRTGLATPTPPSATAVQSSKGFLGGHGRGGDTQERNVVKGISGCTVGSVESEVRWEQSGLEAVGNAFLGNHGGIQDPIKMPAPPHRASPQQNVASKLPFFHQSTPSPKARTGPVLGSTILPATSLGVSLGSSYNDVQPGRKKRRVRGDEEGLGNLSGEVGLRGRGGGGGGGGDAGLSHIRGGKGRALLPQVEREMSPDAHLGYLGRVPALNIPEPRSGSVMSLLVLKEEVM